MRLFKKKDRNLLFKTSISDVLIGYTLNVIGNSKENIIQELKKLEFTEKPLENGATLLALLDNNCILGISLENDVAFKINIWLNHKVTNTDSKNLDLFALLHENDYYFYKLLDEDVNRHLIAFESKIY